MNVVAQNISNAETTRTKDGTPYRRKEVLFRALLDGSGGVDVAGVVDDQSPFQSVYIPGHPHADQNGMVLMPNVDIPLEMVDSMTASRAYEANLLAMRSFRDMAERTLSLLR
ncbi:MAG: flagellar basal body rod protein FlgC [Planctomycetota bacterium]